MIQYACLKGNIPGVLEVGNTHCAGLVYDVRHPPPLRMPVGNVRVSVKFGEAGAAAKDVTRPPRSWQERRPDQKLGVQPSEKQPGFGWQPAAMS